MPVKRRASKRHDPKSYGTWSAVFDCGYDFFDELPALGVATDAYGKPDREQALEAWQRHGEKWLAEHPHDEPQWAETEFGRPWEDRHAR